MIVIGFQQMHPEEFVILAEVIGNLSSLNLPYNLQNTIGNWLQLLGQVLITFNGQQQYFEQGPGRVFQPQHFNIDNPDCFRNQTASLDDLASLSQQVEQLQSSLDTLKKSWMNGRKSRKIWTNSGSRGRLSVPSSSKNDKSIDNIIEYEYDEAGNITKITIGITNVEGKFS